MRKMFGNINVPSLHFACLCYSSKELIQENLSVHVLVGLWRPQLNNRSGLLVLFSIKTVKIATFIGVLKDLCIFCLCHERKNQGLHPFLNQECA